MAPPCTCPSSSGGKKLAAAGLVGVALLAAGHAKPGHATAKPAAAVVADAVRPADARGFAAVAYARRQLGQPYLWGGTGQGGFDCSGLVMEAWRHAGVDIERTSQKQWATLPHISRAQLRPGDLVLFAGGDGTQSEPGHVVMYVGGGQVIQAYAPGVPVEISPLDDVGAGPLTGYARPGGA